jgi:hypothetical protein
LKIDDWRNLAASGDIVVILSGDFGPEGHKSCFGVSWPLSRACPPGLAVLRSEQLADSTTEVNVYRLRVLAGGRDFAFRSAGLP